MKDLSVFVLSALPWIAVGATIAVLLVRKKGKKKENAEDCGSIGMCLGMCLGLLTETAIGSNTGLGISLGMFLGLVVSSAISKREESK